MHILKFGMRSPCSVLLLALMLHASTVYAEPESTISLATGSEQGTSLDTKLNTALEQRQQVRSGYVARSDGVRDFFNALSIRLKKPVVVSKQAAQRKISGDFDLTRPQEALEQMALQLGLIWYHDGQSIYVYDASEARNTVVALKNITIRKLQAFLQQSGLYDRRFPFRGAESGNVFYLSAPPVYVDLVASTARFLDGASTERSLGNLKIGVVRLQNTFVGDRTFTLRDTTSTILGMASVIEQILKDEKIAIEMSTAPSVQNPEPLPPLSSLSSLSPMTVLPPPLSRANPILAPFPSLEGGRVTAPAAKNLESTIRVLAYPDTNSLLIKGTPEQVTFIENLIATLDVAKRHVELSLWIIDMEADQLDQLGVSWQGSLGIPNLGSVTFNRPVSTLDGARFLTAVQALNASEKARIVSRPVVLTQENTPAFFDHNRTFYVKLQGERAVQLEHITFGTLIKVLPRFATDGQIEMALDIEDGNEVSSDGSQTEGTFMPKVARTRISTIARVPKGSSLLVGGYTRDEGRDRIAKIPFLGDLPWIGGAFRSKIKHESNMVRVFLIEPRYDDQPRLRDASDLINDVIGDMPKAPQQDALRDYVGRKNGN
ncbi:type III secretion system outer membrane ring subunit SctC [Glaciimonas sp. PCH181]|uniref:type III secretion system outer membrane ring subunit SctC n=1 Tax=Glaciimonas sp. PCH181 TaxID=2133943 RepID=UPI000D348FBA|nr:type III secretion system outer membrane ring subunit SctC [Glaciimonas sp. PCH181]PUA19956.1 EscC/YscC/HrcC family type III secretion system outer membrane ring protein [Glaciimonas sp. PCH181]